jgi:hypothetical protein
MKRRICSYDLAAVPEDGYVVTDDGGEIYLCNARCLCIWAVSLATKPGLSEELKTRRLVLKVPAGEELVFETIAGLARWASSHALGTPSSRSCLRIALRCQPTSRPRSADGVAGGVQTTLTSPIDSSNFRAR